ncbi:hypothetical protein VCEDC020_003335A, partial [Vibrio cholerae O1 str. EDC-020]
MVAVVVFEFSG